MTHFFSLSFSPHFFTLHIFDLFVTRARGFINISLFRTLFSWNFHFRFSPVIRRTLTRALSFFLSLFLLPLTFFFSSDVGAQVTPNRATFRGESLPSLWTRASVCVNSNHIKQKSITTPCFFFCDSYSKFKGLVDTDDAGLVTSQKGVPTCLRNIWFQLCSSIPFDGDDDEGHRIVGDEKSISPSRHWLFEFFSPRRESCGYTVTWFYVFFFCVSAGWWCWQTDLFSGRFIGYGAGNEIMVQC